MGKSKKEIAGIAAKWWAEAIVEPQHDNGDNSGLGFFAMVLAEFSVDNVEAKSIEKFIEILTYDIENDIDDRYKVVLGCDYDPCDKLENAAKKSGISHYNFPWKTTMWIGRNSISVSHGYRGEIKYLYANKQHWYNEIKRAKEAIKELMSGKRFLWIEDEEERKKKIEKEIKMYEGEIENKQKLYEEAEE